MNFFVSPMWYVDLAVLLFGNFLNFFGYHNNGTKSKQVELFGGIIVWIALIGGFIFVGWIGGLASLILNFLIVGRIARFCSYLVFKLFHPAAKLLNYKMFKLRDFFKDKQEKERRKFEKDPVGSLLESDSNQRDFHLARAKQNGYTMNYLKQVGESENKLDEIYDSLINTCGREYVAFIVINSVQLIKWYIELENLGYSQMDITYEIAESIGGFY